MPGVGRVIGAHNGSVLERRARGEGAPVGNCSCGMGNDCPLRGNCVMGSVVCRADLAAGSGSACSCIGLTEREFWRGWCAHRRGFGDSKCRLSAELSGLVWELGDNGIERSMPVWAGKL